MKENRVLELNNVSFKYNNDKIILRHANASFNKASINGIVGLSGSGKTTLIKLINGSLIKDNRYSYEGVIKVFSKDITKYKELNRSVGTVYQDPDNQIIFTKVIDEVVFGMENYNETVSYMDSKLKEVLELLGMNHLEERDPNQLSGGEKQLVVLAAILTLDVEILVLDECMTGVSNNSRIQVLDIIRKLRDQGKCIIMVEHDFENLIDANEIFELNHGLLTHTNYHNLTKG